MDSEVKNFIQRISEFTEIQSFLNVYQMVLKSGIGKDSTPQEWLKCLVYMHLKGWLYCSYEEGRLSVIVGAYRIKEFDEEKSHAMPENEEGNILFVRFSISRSKDKLSQLKLLRTYLKDNPDVTEVVYELEGQDKKYKKISLKGELNGQEQKSELTNATVE